MLVDDHYNIVCLGDWEFTYAAPPEYQCSLTSWLILSKPHVWTEEDYRRYCGQLELFLGVLREVEEEREGKGEGGLEQEKRLSEVIRKSHVDGSFWFVLCARCGLFFDDLWERFQKFGPVDSGSRAVEETDGENS